MKADTTNSAMRLRCSSADAGIVEARDDLARSTGRRVHAVPARHLETRHRITHARNLRIV
jgi:hypothetical protein